MIKAGITPLQLMNGNLDDIGKLMVEALGRFAQQAGIVPKGAHGSTPLVDKRGCSHDHTLPSLFGGVGSSAPMMSLQKHDCRSRLCRYTEQFRTQLLHTTWTTQTSAVPPSRPRPLDVLHSAPAKVTGDERIASPPEHLIDWIISHDFIHDAVITPIGYTYDRKVIERWIEEHGTCPVTRAPLQRSQLLPNRAIQGQIAAWKASAQVRNNRTD